MNKCIYLTSDGYCELHSDGIELREPCVEGPCDDEVYEQALKAKQEREKGCEYCRERKPILSELGDLQIDDTDSTLWFIHQAAADDIYEEHTTIQFCPMCGRELTLIEGIPEAGKEDMRKSGICERDIENFDRIVKNNRIKNAKDGK